MGFRINALTDNDRNIISNYMKELWGDDIVIAHGEVFDTRNLPGYKAMIDFEFVGFLHYQIRGEECEIITLSSLVEAKGIGSGLIAAVEETARAAHCRKLSLITTNDNLHALGFYQRRGFYLVALSPGQIKESRKLKSSIPEFGYHHIPIRDELRLEKIL